MDSDNRMWEELYDLATGDEESGSATIDPLGIYAVKLTWPDGSTGVWEWHGRQWHAAEELDSAPRDVAARDAL